MLETIFSSFILVAASEMGDKTQLLAFSLAARFKKPWPIMGGILAATLLNHLLAASLGQWLSARMEPSVMSLILGVTFILFGIWTLKPDTLDDASLESQFGVFMTTLLLFFMAEMGDKTQFATVALAAKFNSVGLVTLGTTLGMMISDGLAVLLGEKLAAHAKSRSLRFVAAGLFFAFGIYSLVEGYFTKAA